MYLTVPFLLALLAPSSLSFSSCQKDLCRVVGGFFPPLQPTTGALHVFPRPLAPVPGLASRRNRPALTHQRPRSCGKAALWVTRAWKGTQGLRSLSYPSSCSLMQKAGVSHRSNQLTLSLSGVRARVSLEPPCSRQANHRELIIF